MRIPFQKFQGTGNDFVFVDGQDLPERCNRVDLSRRMCQRNFSVGADGLVVIQNFQNSPFDTFAWDFYNSDGSFAEMCGNAARCAVVYAYRRAGLVSCQFKTHIGMISGQYSSNPAITFKLANPQAVEKSVKLPLGTEVRGFAVNTGVPHFVIVADEDQDIDNETCEILQNLSEFAPDKVNITLLEAVKSLPIKTRTFERGVSAFTLACGTGVMASALVLHSLFAHDEAELMAPGGLLRVKMDQLPLITLQGPAAFIFSGEFEI